MTLLQLIREIEAVAEQQPAVQMIVRDNVLALNHVPHNEYGAFVWTQREHTVSDRTDVRTYRFTFFYVDRVTAGRGNVADVQSTGIEVLSNIIRTLTDRLDNDAGDWVAHTFTQRFTDDCAGTYVEVEFQVLGGTSCAIDYDDEGVITSEGWTLYDVDGYQIIARPQIEIR